MNNDNHTSEELSISIPPTTVCKKQGQGERSEDVAKLETQASTKKSKHSSKLKELKLDDIWLNVFDHGF